MVKLVRINCRTVPLNNTNEERAVAKRILSAETRIKRLLKIMEMILLLMSMFKG
jgi:hypothetical protein